MGQIVYLNGELVPSEDAHISAFDRGFLHGYGLFETMRSYGGHVFALDRHLARLKRSAERLALDVGLDMDEVERAIYETLRVNGLSDARIRLTVSGGVGEREMTPPASGRPTVVVVAEELTLPPHEAYARGISAAIVKPRRNSQSALRGIKSTGYLENLMARAEAKAGGADEAVMLDERGFVAECSTSNIFIVSGGRLVTPPAAGGILPGITRDIILELALVQGIETVEGDISVDELYNAGEVFLTNSVVEVVPIVEVDARAIGTGKPGEVTKALAEAYTDLALKRGHD